MSETERTKVKPKPSKKFRTITPSPRSVWHDLDFSSDEEHYPELPRRTISEEGPSWINFRDMVLGQRLLL